MPRFDNLSAEELEQIRRMIEEMDTIDVMDDDMRALVEKHWP
jgi:tetrahydromethanopterin S-methyltransferase subunit A